MGDRFQRTPGPSVASAVVVAVAMLCVVGHFLIGATILGNVILVGAAVLLSATAAVLAAVSLAVSDRRRERGECERFGYDLRGSSRCPECGHAE